VKRPSVSLPSVVDLLADPAVFGPHFQPAASWAACRVALKALFALPMAAEEVEVYRQHTGRCQRGGARGRGDERSDEGREPGHDDVPPGCQPQNSEAAGDAGREQ
jgi:hypothetical protein